MDISSLRGSSTKNLNTIITIAPIKVSFLVEALAFSSITEKLEPLHCSHPLFPPRFAKLGKQMGLPFFSLVLSYHAQ